LHFYLFLKKLSCLIDLFFFLLFSSSCCDCQFNLNDVQWMEEEMQARRARGEDNGVFGQIAIVKAVTIRLKNEMQAYHKEIARQHGNVYVPEDEKDSLLASMDEQMPVVRPGDASVAAPFTSRTPSIKAVVDLIRQGRCTMLSALQQQQIMMLECMIYAFTLSALSLEGARSSERQMMVSGQLLGVSHQP
jgi:cation-transporting ATPase 13A1